MILGCLVNGIGPMKSQKVVLLPWGALFEIDGKPAVWIDRPRQQHGFAEAGDDRSLQPRQHRHVERPQIRATSSSPPACQMLRPGQKVEIAAEPKP